MSSGEDLLQHPYVGPVLIVAALAAIQAFKFLPDAGLPPAAGIVGTLMWGLSWGATLCLAYGALRTLEETVWFIHSKWRGSET